MDDDPGSGFLVLFLFLFVVGIFAFIGHLIGKSKGRSTGGAAMGALFGPVGLVGAAFLSDKRRQCPACKGHVPDEARKCMHCGEELPAPPPEPKVEMEMVFDSDAGTYVSKPKAPPQSPPQGPSAQKSPDPKKIPCPLCGQLLRVDSLKVGENWCHHCFGKFIAES